MVLELAEESHDVWWVFTPFIMALDHSWYKHNEYHKLSTGPRLRSGAKDWLSPLFQPLYFGSLRSYAKLGYYGLLGSLSWRPGQFLLWNENKRRIRDCWQKIVWTAFSKSFFWNCRVCWYRHSAFIASFVAITNSNLHQLYGCYFLWKNEWKVSCSLWKCGTFWL